MLGIFVAAVMAASADRADMLGQTSARFELALQRNDVPALERVLSPDWLIIDSDGHLISREQFLRLLRSGELSHSAMQSSDLRVRVYGDSAVITALANGHGSYRGQAFDFAERSTDVWIWTNGRWLCAFTQLTRMKQVE